MVLGTLAIVCPEAKADTVSEVEDLIRQGVELRKDGKDLRALPLFQNAYDLVRSPRTAGQLGLCQLATGYWLDAERHLAEGLSSPQHPWIEKNHVALESALATSRRNIGAVTVTGGPSGAVVIVDRREIGRLPIDHPVRLEKGPHDLEVRSPGYEASERTLTIVGGDEQVLNVDLRQKTAKPDRPLPGPGPAEAIPDADSSTDRHKARRTLAWVAAGTAGVFLVLGAVETARWLGAKNEFESHSGPLPTDMSMTGKNCGAGEIDRGGPGCAALYGKFSNARTLAILGYGLSAGLAVGSVLLFATSADSRPMTQARLNCSADPLGRLLACEISF